MKSVLRHELKTYFSSAAAYVFGAFLLMFTGIGAMMYNINASVSNFEYVLEFCSIVFIVIVPILTMRVIAEERKQKTDQLLFSLPITTTEIVLGKFLALLTVFAVPLIIICFYPLIFSKFGDVYLPTSYGSIIAFFFLGAALIAVGVFISSLTDNQGLAAGISVAVILFNYFSVTLSEHVSSSAYSSLIAILVLIVAVVLIVKSLTGSANIGYLSGIILCVAVAVLYFINSGNLEGLLPSIMTKLSLFKQFSTFVSGVFDLTALVYFISVIVLFLFLSVQSLEKRRYN